MPTIHSNPGVAELAALTTMGASVKEDSNAIGYFGTGFKYAIATLLRNRAKVQLFLGTEEHVFTAVPTLIRGETFDVVHLDDQSLGFTTQLGRNWELWMAFRELHSNALDEHGDTHIIAYDNEVRAVDGETQIIIYSPQYEQIDRANVFAEGPGLSGCEGWVHSPSFENRHVYYRGVRAYELPKEVTARYKYNLKSACTLTEDRTLRNYYDIYSHVGNFLTRTCTNRQVLEDVIAASAVEGQLESSFDYDWSDPSDLFVEIAVDAWHRGIKLSAGIRAVLRRRRPELDKPESVELDEVQDAYLNKAIDFVCKMGYDVSNLNIVIVQAGSDCSLDRGMVLIPVRHLTSSAGIASVLIRAYCMTKKDSGFGAPDLAGILANELVRTGQRLLKEYL